MKENFKTRCGSAGCPFNDKGVCTLPEIVDNTFKGIDDWIRSPIEAPEQLFAWTYRDLVHFRRRTLGALSKKECKIPGEDKRDMKDKFITRIRSTQKMEELKIKIKKYKATDISRINAISNNRFHKPVA